MQRFADPLGPLSEPVRLADPAPTLGEPLSAVLEPVPSYGESYGDALAVPPPAADPLALPPLPPPDRAADGAAPADEATAGGAAPRGAAPESTGPYEQLAEAYGQFAERYEPLTDRPGDEPTARPTGPPTGPTGPPTLPGASGFEPADNPTVRTAVVPRLGPPPAGGRITVGLPRGYDPPSVPATRGWSRLRTAPPPQPQRRRSGAVPAFAGGPGTDPEMPPELAAALARLQARRAGKRRGVGGRITAMFLFALLLLEAVATRTYGGAVVFAIILALIGLTFYRRPDRRPQDAFLRLPAG